MATSSSSPTDHGHRRCLVEQGQPSAPPQPRHTEAKDGEEIEQTRDWAAGLPLDALLAVLGRLDVVDVLVGAGHVCRPWRRAAREEPQLWRRIDMRPHAAKLAAYRVQAAAGAAVRRSAGRCEAFWAERLRGDQYSFLLFLADAAPQLKSLRLISCNAISKHGLNAAIRKLPMLEELELSLIGDTAGPGLCSLAETCAVVAAACPLLRRLRLNKHRFHWRSVAGDGEAMEVARMRGLRSLQLVGNNLSNAGLAAILDGCAGLESLDIRHCFNVEVNDEMRARYGRLQTLRLPSDSMDDYELSFGRPEMDPGSPEDEGSPEYTDNIGSWWYFR